MASLEIDWKKIESDEQERLTRLFPDFKTVKLILSQHVRQFVPLVGQFHDGRSAFDKGNERYTLNPMRDDKHCGSFSVNLSTGAWIDRATGESGSVLDLWGGIRREGLQEAARSAIEAFGFDGNLSASCIPNLWRNVPGMSQPSKGKETPEWSPAPSGTSPVFHSKSGNVMNPSSLFEYVTDTGELAFFVGRFEWPGIEKFFIPAYWSINESWEFSLPLRFKGKRPVYNLQALVSAPRTPVLIVEGEKAAEAAMKMSHGVAVTTWHGGAGSVLETDWSPLEGRLVVLWPDNDKPGRDAMSQLAGLLKCFGCQVLAIQIPAEKPDAWDAWDCLQEDPSGRTGSVLVSVAVRVL